MFPSTTGPTASVEEANQLIGAVLESGFASLLEDRDVKHFCLAQLHEYGCRAPANHVLMFCLRKLVRLGETFAAETIKAKLLDLLQSNAGVASFFRGLENLQSGNRDRNALKAALLAQLAATPDPQAVAADMTTELDIITTLHASSKLAGLEASVADLAATLHESIEKVMRDLTDPVLRIAGPNGNWEQEAADQSVADRLKYTSGLFPFRGREAEIVMLRDFLMVPGPSNQADPFRWLLLTGPGGEGKSRLALEFCKSWLPNGWIGGQLDLDALRNLVSGPFNWRPRKPTLFVVDYPAQDPETVGKLLAMLDRDANQFDLPVRVLLLERDSQGEWFRTMLPETSATARVRDRAFLDTPEGTPVAPLAPQAIVETMADRFQQRGVEPPEPGMLLMAANRIDSRGFEHNGQFIPLPRALFAVAAAELLADARADGQLDLEAVIHSLDREKVLASLVERDRARRWRPAAGGDRQLLRQHETLYAIATMCLGLPLDALEDPVLDSLRASGMLPAFRDSQLLDALASTDVEAHLPALEPDILGEYFALDAFASLAPPHRERLTDASYHLGGDSFVVFCLRCLNDFPDRTLALRPFLPSREISETGALAFSGFSIDLTRLKGTDPAALSNVSQLKAIQSTWSTNLLLAQRTAMVAVNLAYHASQEGDVEGGRVAEGWIASLRNNWHQDTGLALFHAQLLFNAANGSLEIREPHGFKEAYLQLVSLVEQFPTAADITLLKAQIVFNVLNTPDLGVGWPEPAEMLRQLEQLHHNFPEDRGIAVQLAMGYGSIAMIAVDAQDWDLADAQMQAITLLRSVFPLDAEISMQKAKVAVNLVGGTGRAALWDRTGSALQLLRDLRSTFPQSRDIALQLAMAAVNATNAAGSAGTWEIVEAAYDMIQEIVPHFQEDAELVATAGQAVARRHHAYRQHQQEPDLDATQEAVAAARACVAWNVDHESTRGVAMSLQVIADAHRRFPDDAEITEVYQWFGEDMDWSQVPPIT